MLSGDLEISKHPGHFYGVKAVNSGTGVKTPEGSCFEGQSRTIELDLVFLEVWLNRHGCDVMCMLGGRVGRR